MIWLLDTSILIGLRDGQAKVVAAVAELGGELVMSAISRVELEGGVYRISALAALRRSRTDVVLRAIEVLAFTSNIAAKYGQIVAAAGFVRSKINDRMIAAQALAIDATLVTHNGDDFRDISGLRLAIWPTT